jgi:hypothetical protein
MLPFKKILFLILAWSFAEQVQALHKVEHVKQLLRRRPTWAATFDEGFMQLLQQGAPDVLARELQRREDAMREEEKETFKLRLDGLLKQRILYAHKKGRAHTRIAVVQSIAGVGMLLGASISFLIGKKLAASYELKGAALKNYLEAIAPAKQQMDVAVAGLRELEIREQKAKTALDEAIRELEIQDLAVPPSVSEVGTDAGSALQEYKKAFLNHTAALAVKIEFVQDELMSKREGLRAVMASSIAALKQAPEAQQWMHEKLPSKKGKGKETQHDAFGGIVAHLHKEHVQSDAHAALVNDCAWWGTMAFLALGLLTAGKTVLHDLPSMLHYERDQRAIQALLAQL